MWWIVGGVAAGVLVSAIVAFAVVGLAVGIAVLAGGWFLLTGAALVIGMIGPGSRVT